MQRAIFLYGFLMFLALITVFAATGDYFMRKNLEASVEVQLEQEMSELYGRVMAMLMVSHGSAEQEESQQFERARGVTSDFRLGKGFGREAYGWILDPGRAVKMNSPRARVFFPQYLTEDIREAVPQILESPREPRSGILKLGRGSMERLVVYKALEAKGWIVGITYPLAETWKFYGHFRTGMLILFLCLVVLALLVSLLCARQFTTPVFLAAGYTNLVATGESPEAPKPSHYHEVDSIVQAVEKIKRLLDERSSVDLNPLTGMPGNRELQQALFERIDGTAPFAVVFIDINSFSGFNNKYGFERGDSVIRFAATLVVNSVKEAGNRDDFICHLGGDKLCFITTPDRADRIAEEIVRTFDSQIGHFYSAEDRERGYLISKDRLGNFRKFDLMSVIVAIATNETRPLIHPLQIAHITSEICNFLKSRPGSQVMKDRRTADRPEETAAEGAAGQAAKAATGGETALEVSVDPKEPVAEAQAPVAEAKEPVSEAQAPVEPKEPAAEAQAPVAEPKEPVAEAQAPVEPAANAHQETAPQAPREGDAKASDAGAAGGDQDASP